MAEQNKYFPQISTDQNAPGAPSETHLPSYWLDSLSGLLMAGDSLKLLQTSTWEQVSSLQVMGTKSKCFLESSW
jgi:hypothetical protein